MILKGFVLTNMGVNCYVLICEKTMQAAIIDPAGEVEDVLKRVQEDGAKVQYIINTHGHVDHIGGDYLMRKLTGAPVLIHEDDADRLEKEDDFLREFSKGTAKAFKADRLLHDGDTIQIGETIQLEVIHTPGHTPGGICLKLTGEDLIFSGDTLFHGSIGRTDFPGGDFPTLMKSIHEKLMPFPDETAVYPGHGTATSIGFERRANPFVLGYMHE